MSNETKRKWLFPWNKTLRTLDKGKTLQRWEKNMVVIMLLLVIRRGKRWNWRVVFCQSFKQKTEEKISIYISPVIYTNYWSRGCYKMWNEPKICCSLNSPNLGRNERKTHADQENATWRLRKTNWRYNKGSNGGRKLQKQGQNSGRMIQKSCSFIQTHTRQCKFE
jgi:hypothetical protein